MTTTQRWLDGNPVLTSDVAKDAKWDGGNPQYEYLEYTEETIETPKWSDGNSVIIESETVRWADGGVSSFYNTSDIDGEIVGSIGTIKISGTDTTLSKISPLNVYYSVSFYGTDDIKTGNPNISITDGIATLDAAQTGNIGQGCRITYDSSAHYCFISLVNSSTSFNVVDEHGVAMGNHTSVAVNSIAHEYVNLTAAEAGAYDANHVNNTSLVAANVILNFCCYYDHSDYTADTTTVTIDGWTTDATRYINIYTPTGGTQSINNQRHSGIWDTNKYRIEATSTASNQGPIMFYQVNFGRVTGIQFKCTWTGYPSCYGVRGYATTGSSDIRVSKCIFDITTDGNEGNAIVSDTSTTVMNVFNNVLYGNDAVQANAIRLTDGTLNAYNNTIYRFQRGLNRVGGTGTAYNNIVTACGNTNAIVGTWTENYNATDGTDAGFAGANDRTGQTFTFVDLAGRDFHLNSTDAGAKDQGTHDPSSGIFHDDITGYTRPESNWDIGAFEYYDHPTYHSLSPFGDGDIKTGSPNISIMNGVATISEPQTGNIGQGDIITYNGNTVYISQVNSSTSFNVVTSSGYRPSDQCSIAVTSINHEYASLSLAEAGLDQDLTASDLVMNICCYYDHADYTADTTTVTIDGWTTDATRYINVYTPTGGTQSINKQGHSGVWDDTKYHLSRSDNHGIIIQDSGINITSLQVKSVGGNGNTAILGNTGGGGNISRCIIENSGTNGEGFRIAGSGTYNIFNNLFLDISGSGAIAMALEDGSGFTCNAYNNTFINCLVGARGPGSGATCSHTFKNNLIYTQGLSGAAATTLFTSGITCGYNATDLSSLGTNYPSGTGNRVSQTFTFSDEANDNFALASTDAGAKDYGTDLSGTFTDDITGKTRGGIWEIGAFGLPSDVYHSLSLFGSDDLSNDSPNISITNGVATLSVAQTGNIGQGDIITYGGHTCYISKVNSSTSFNVITSAGAWPDDHTSVAVTSITHEYGSLSLAEAGLNQNLVTADLVMNICCYYDHSDYTADSTGVTFNGWTTDSTRYLNIYTPTGGTQSINKQRHSGIWDDTKYHLSISANSWVRPLNVNSAYARIHGLQISLPDNTNNVCVGLSACYSFYGNILKFIGNGLYGIYNSCSNYVYNNLIIGFPTGTIFDENVNYYYYNNTFIDCTVGMDRDSGTNYVKNNLFHGCGTATTGLTGGANVDYNATDLAGLGYTDTGGHSRVSQTFSFVGVDDFHLLSSDLGAVGLGVNLATIFIDDIDGETIQDPWCIGADWILYQALGALLDLEGFRFSVQVE
jgi:hypothetical protein